MTRLRDLILYYILCGNNIKRLYCSMKRGSSTNQDWTHVQNASWPLKLPIQLFKFQTWSILWHTGNPILQFVWKWRMPYWFSSVWSTPWAPFFKGLLLERCQSNHAHHKKISCHGFDSVLWQLCCFQNQSNSLVLCDTLKLSLTLHEAEDHEPKISLSRLLGKDHYLKELGWSIQVKILLVHNIMFGIWVVPNVFCQHGVFHCAFDDHLDHSAPPFYWYRAEIEAWSLLPKTMWIWVKDDWSELAQMFAKLQYWNLVNPSLILKRSIIGVVKCIYRHAIFKT